MVVLTLLSRHTFLDGVLLTCSVRSGEESGEAGRFFMLLEGVVNSVLRSDLAGDECACGDPGRKKGVGSPLHGVRGDAGVVPGFDPGSEVPAFRPVPVIGTGPDSQEAVSEILVVWSEVPAFTSVP